MGVARRRDAGWLSGAAMWEPNLRAGLWRKAKALRLPAAMRQRHSKPLRISNGFDQPLVRR